MTRIMQERDPWHYHRSLPACFWRRVAVLWSFAPVPFFDAFDGGEETRLAGVEDHLGTTEES